MVGGYEEKLTFRSEQLLIDVRAKKSYWTFAGGQNQFIWETWEWKAFSFRNKLFSAYHDISRIFCVGYILSSERRPLDEALPMVTSNFKVGQTVAIGFRKVPVYDRIQINNRCYEYSSISFTRSSGRSFRSVTRVWLSAKERNRRDNASA